MWRSHCIILELLRHRDSSQFKKSPHFSYKFRQYFNETSENDTAYTVDTLLWRSHFKTLHRKHTRYRNVTISIHIEVTYIRHFENHKMFSSWGDDAFKIPDNFWWKFFWIFWLSAHGVQNFGIARQNLLQNPWFLHWK